MSTRRQGARGGEAGSVGTGIGMGARGGAVGSSRQALGWRGRWQGVCSRGTNSRRAKCRGLALPPPVTFSLAQQ